MKRKYHHWKRLRSYGNAVYGRNYMGDKKPTKPMFLYKCPKCGDETRHTRKLVVHCSRCCIRKTLVEISTPAENES